MLQASGLHGGALLQTLPSEAGPNMAMAGALLVGVPVGATVGFVVGRRGGESWEPVRILEEGEPTKETAGRP